MPLSAGTRLGPYEILEPIGAGGMGEVYRAKDTRLDRAVAIKVLPEDLAADPDLRARFEREAKAISALAHPNICTLHDVGEEAGQTFLVMEHLVGQTLAERLKKGPLSLDQALQVATEIADGLAAAHREGIVHRDLKPGNVMLTKTGARLLDFGLARLTGQGEQPAVQAESSAPTEHAPLTGAGTVMGTLPYMAPEQVEGKPADARTDLWALGLILYEMLSGSRAFDAPTPTRLVAAILEGNPAPLSERQPVTPPSLERLISRCLAKDPDDRWDGAHDVAVRLREIAGPDNEAEPPSRRLISRWVTPLAVALLAFLAGVLTQAWWLGRGTGPRSVVRSEVNLTSDRALAADRRGRPRDTQLALSPDGTLLAWSGAPDGTRAGAALYVRRLDTGEVRRLPGTEKAHMPFFSPDSLWIGFVQLQGGAKLRRVSVDGTRAAEVAELPIFPSGASWAEGGIYLGSRIGGINKAGVEGGPLEPVTVADQGEAHFFPSLIPGSDVLLVTTSPATFGGKAENLRVEAFSLGDGTRKVLVENAADGRYLHTGHLLFARRGVLMAAPFDLDRLELTASPVPVLDGVLQALNAADDRGGGAAQFTVSEAGLLVYAPGGIYEDPPNTAVVVDDTGRTEPLPGFDRPMTSGQFRVSPDGRRLASVDRARSGLLWLFDMVRQTSRALTREGIAASPDWSPDGTQLVAGWQETGAGNGDLWLFPVEGGGERRRLTEGNLADSAPSWSPDGKVVAFVRGGWREADIYLYAFDDGRATPFLATSAREAHPDFSPDGRWLAYSSNESGRREVYVTSFPDGARSYTVSREGGTSPVWASDGRTLYFASLYRPQSMMAVSVEVDTFDLGAPRTLFTVSQGFAFLSPMRSFERHPREGHFILVRLGDTEQTPITQLNLVHNWFTELERLAPTGR